jgi:hypothetical protein
MNRSVVRRFDGLHRDRLNLGTFQKRTRRRSMLALSFLGSLGILFGHFGSR